jgi:hypothetical protein
MSKLNPQKASAYVGPGVLKQGGKITKVPNGPLIKKKGPFKGSTLKSGGKVKKAQGGGGMDIMGMVGGLMGGGGSGGDDKKKEAAEAKAKALNDMIGGVVKNSNNLTKDNRFSNNMSAKSGKTIKKKAKSGASTTTTKTTNPIGVKLLKEGKNYKAQVTKNVGGKNATYEGVSTNMNFAQELANDKALTRPADSLRTAKKNGGKIKKAQGGESFTKDDEGYTYTKQVTKPEGKRTYQGKSIDQATAMKIANFKSRVTPSDSLRTVKHVVKKNGGMLKRADGSYSKRGLWDNLRSKAAQNKKTGAKPKSPTKQMLVQEKKIKAKSKK